MLGLADRFLRPDYLLSAAIAIKVHGGETPQDFHRDDNPARCAGYGLSGHVGLLDDLDAR